MDSPARREGRTKWEKEGYVTKEERGEPREGERAKQEAVLT